MKFKNTYSRKKRGNAKTNVVKINVYNILSVNITNNSSTQEKPESSKSESSDLFDKLVKGPMFNVNNQSTFGSSDYSRQLFFSQRQDTATFYKSDAELSDSTDISNHLFKDSKDSKIFSPTWQSPPEYCKIKNKLVKVTQAQQIPRPLKKNKFKLIISQNKTNNRIHKNTKVTRLTKHQIKEKSESCTSSTPTCSKALLNKDIWPDTHVSPIMPHHYTPKRKMSSEHTVTTEQNQKAGTNSSFSVTALIECLDNLGIKTPHPKNVPNMVDCGEDEPELLNYTMPLLVPINQQSEKLDGDNSQKSFKDTPCKVSEEENRGELNLLQVDEKSLSQNCTNMNNCKSNKKTSINSGVLKPQQKRIEKEDIFEVSESESFFSERPDCSDSNDVSECSASRSPSTKALEDPETSIVSKYEEPSPSNISFPVSKKTTSNEYVEETDQINSTLSSCKTENTSSDSKLESINVEEENSEKSSDDSNLNSSSPIEKYSGFDCLLAGAECKGSQYHPKEMNKYNNLTKIEIGENKLEVYKKDSSVSSLNDLDNQESLVEDLHINFERKDMKSETHIKDQEISSSYEGNCKKSLAKDLTGCGSQPLSDMTNLTLDTLICVNTGEINKKSIPPSKINVKTALFCTNDKLSSTTELNKTSVKLNLEAGKKWRRSLLRQKQPESKLDRRASIGCNTLVRLIKESSGLSCLANDTKLSFNNTTRIINSLFEDQNSSLRVLGGSPGFNFSFSKIETRRRRNYICDMNEIPEEISDHSTSKSNETELCEELSVLEQDKKKPVECEKIETSLNQTNIYDTPPILKMNPEALSAITDRKQSRRYQARSFGECSIYPEGEELEDGTSDEENNLSTSCCSKLELEDDLLNDEDIEMMGKVSFLLRCGQQEPIPFTEAFPDRVLSTGQKIGEGVYGEVFMLERPGEARSVIKIIPLEGSQMVNGALQKRFDEVLSELIITEELSMLRQNSLHRTAGFCELKNKFYLQGKYPSKLLNLWHEFDCKKGSDNECPDMFGPNQLYLALELAHAGEPVESFGFKSPKQALAVFLQTTFSLAIAESAADFEHRDLHIGNVLVQTTSELYITFIISGIKFECPTYGTIATIIDYTLSRISFKDDVLYLDLENDPELFTAEGDYQFDIYRHMRSDLNSNWRDHQPKTNVRWLHYLIFKLTSDQIKYKQKKSTKTYKENMEKLVQIREMILDFYSATDVAQYLTHTYTQTVSILRS